MNRRKRERKIAGESRLQTSNSNLKTQLRLQIFQLTNFFNEKSTNFLEYKNCRLANFKNSEF